jgi:hypothetical protein
MTLRKKKILQIERGSTRSHPVDNSLWKRLRTFRKTDCRTNKAIGRPICSSSRDLLACKWYYKETKSEMTLCAQQSGVPREIIREHPFCAGQNVVITFKKACPEEWFGVCRITTSYSFCVIKCILVASCVKHFFPCRNCSVARHWSVP